MLTRAHDPFSGHRRRPVPMPEFSELEPVEPVVVVDVVSVPQHEPPAPAVVPVAPQKPAAKGRHRAEPKARRRSPSAKPAKLTDALAALDALRGEQ